MEADQPSRTVKWMTENWFTPDGKGVFGGGFRLLGERFSADVGLMLVVDRDEPHMSVLPLPVFGVALLKRNHKSSQRNTKTSGISL